MDACHAQDAFTKTVPIWAAVLNRAVAAHREAGHQPPAGPASTGGAAAWDEELHLPPWISASEASHIRERLAGWAQQLLQACLGPHRSTLLLTSQSGCGAYPRSMERCWISGLCMHAPLPIVRTCLMGGSAHAQVLADIGGLAAVLRKPLRPLWVSQASRIWLDAVPAASELPFTPLFLISASLPNARMRRLAGVLPRQRPLLS